MGHAFPLVSPPSAWAVVEHLELCRNTGFWGLHQKRPGQVFTLSPTLNQIDLLCTAPRSSDRPGTSKWCSVQSFHLIGGGLGYIDHAEELASRFLQCFPKKRLSAQAALHHEYFSHLPTRLWELPDMIYGDDDCGDDDDGDYGNDEDCGNDGGDDGNDDDDGSDGSDGDGCNGGDGSGYDDGGDGDYGTDEDGSDDEGGGDDALREILWSPGAAATLFREFRAFVNVDDEDGIRTSTARSRPNCDQFRLLLVVSQDEEEEQEEKEEGEDTRTLL
ncbi:hypothetical protein NFI96_029811 [Prochilodus magdalenae]|nr:hypothetical protein NFI96_029811 [Prochilodus magdalenae]